MVKFIKFTNKVGMATRCVAVVMKDLFLATIGVAKCEVCGKYICMANIGDIYTDSKYSYFAIVCDECDKQVQKALKEEKECDI